MNMIEVKTAELSGAALGYAVAKVQEDAMDMHWRVVDGEVIGFGSIGSSPEFPCLRVKGYTAKYHSTQVFAPYEEWSQCGPLIAKHLISTGVENVDATLFWAYCGPCWEGRPVMLGETHIIAACRAIVAAKLGDTVQIPAELLP